MASNRPKVLAIGSSPRKGGNTEQFLRFALGIISEHDIDTEYVGLYDKKIDGCISCRHCRVNEIAECAVKDDFQEIFKKVYETDGLILGSPVYFGTQTAKMTGLLERLGMVAEGRHGIDVPLTDIDWPETKGPGLWAGKVGGAIVSTRRTGGNFVLAELLSWFSILGFVIVTGTYWTVAIGGARVPDQVTKAGRSTSELSMDQMEKDPEGVKAVKDFAYQFAHVVNKLKR